METILVNGGAGFIGSYVAKKLLKLGHRVIIYDSFIQYISPLQSNYQNYIQLRFKDIKNDVIIIRGDTRDVSNFRRVINDFNPYRILHLAALPIADLSIKNSEEALSSILQGTVNVLEAIRDANGLERFIYVSSSMIYGDFKKIPCPEDHPKNPKDIYGGTKYAGEVLVETFGRRYGIEYSIIRPSAVYGPTDVNRRVSQIFVENALQKKPVLLHNDGKPVLDFTYVEDIAEGMVLALFSANAKNQVFNITYGHGYSLRDYAETVKKYIPNLEINATPDTDVFRPKRGALDISKAKKMLNYNPKYNLDLGIKSYIDFFNENKVFK